MPNYHVELRNFPRIATLFNQSGQEVGSIVLPWVQDKVIEIQDEKWAPWESTITIIEGPSIPIGGLSMGRGWKTAVREGSDVTHRVLSEARKALSDAGADGAAPVRLTASGVAVPENGHAEPAGSAPDYPSQAEGPASPSSSTPPSDPVSAAGAPVSAEDQLALGVELAGLLGSEPGRLLVAWRAVASRATGLTPSESLALAELELRRGDSPGA